MSDPQSKISNNQSLTPFLHLSCVHGLVESKLASLLNLTNNLLFDTFACSGTFERAARREILMATLTGFAILMQGLPWDHTYVGSDDGYCWPCWGRSAGGNPICSGPGSSVVSDCLSQPNSEAGIKYGITGVCHQTANRILDPAGILVDAANGYGLSELVFGTYGFGSWPQRQLCANLTSGPGSPVKDSGDMIIGKKSSAFVDRIKTIYRSIATDLAPLEDEEAAVAIGNAELRTRFDVFLGSDYDPQKKESVVQLQSNLRREQKRLVQQLESDNLRPEQYVETLNRAINDVFAKCEDILGSTDFEKLFGAPRKRGVDLVAPATFLQNFRG